MCHLFQNEIANMREGESEERAKWERKCRQKLDDEWRAQEDGLREKFLKDRDSELNRVVKKLEAEVVTSRREVEKEYEERIRYDM